MHTQHVTDGATDAFTAAALPVNDYICKVLVSDPQNGTHYYTLNVGRRRQATNTLQDSIPESHDHVAIGDFCR